MVIFACFLEIYYVEEKFLFHNFHITVKRFGFQSSNKQQQSTKLVVGTLLLFFRGWVGFVYSSFCFFQITF